MKSTPAIEIRADTATGGVQVRQQLKTKILGRRRKPVIALYIDSEAYYDVTFNRSFWTPELKNMLKDAQAKWEYAHEQQCLCITCGSDQDLTTVQDSVLEFLNHALTALIMDGPVARGTAVQTTTLTESDMRRSASDASSKRLQDMGEGSLKVDTQVAPGQARGPKSPMIWSPAEVQVDPKPAVQVSRVSSPLVLSPVVVASEHLSAEPVRQTQGPKSPLAWSPTAPSPAAPTPISKSPGVQQLQQQDLAQFQQQDLPQLSITLPSDTNSDLAPLMNMATASSPLFKEGDWDLIRKRAVVEYENFVKEQEDAKRQGNLTPQEESAIDKQITMALKAMDELNMSEPPVVEEQQSERMAITTDRLNLISMITERNNQRGSVAFSNGQIVAAVKPNASQPDIKSSATPASVRANRGRTAFPPMPADTMLGQNAVDPYMAAAVKPQPMHRPIPADWRQSMYSSNSHLGMDYSQFVSTVPMDTRQQFSALGVPSLHQSMRPQSLYGMQQPMSAHLEIPTAHHRVRQSNSAPSSPSPPSRQENPHYHVLAQMQNQAESSLAQQRERLAQERKRMEELQARQFQPPTLPPKDPIQQPLRMDQLKLKGDETESKRRSQASKSSGRRHNPLDARASRSSMSGEKKQGRRRAHTTG